MFGGWGSAFGLLADFEALFELFSELLLINIAQVEVLQLGQTEVHQTVLGLDQLLP